MSGNQRLIILACLFGGVCFSLLRLRPPADDADGFSTAAALKHVQFIASETHPVGLPHHRAVCEYLLNAFTNLGYEVQEQRALSAIPLSNVLARKAGHLPGNKAVMLAAHYDSVRMGPGAGDDSAAVGALLEVARIMAKRDYANDVIFLITDGEELGLYGAREFVDRHPWANEVGVVLNFDARGSSGPSIMYETSDNNGWLIGQFAQTDPHPVCASFTQDVYRRMPNRTDFTIFREKMPGLNFAFIGDYANYHTAYDDVAHLDLASMRHHGLQALAMADKLAQIDLSDIPQQGNDVYFDAMGYGVVHYPQRWAPAIAIFVSGLALVILGIGLQSKVIRFNCVLYSLGMFAINLLAISALTWGILWVARGANLNRSADWATCGFAAIACAMSMAIFVSAQRLSSLELAAAGILVWTVLALLTGFMSRGFSYLTVWPLLFSTIGFAITMSSGFRQSGFVRIVVLTVCALPTVLLLPPVIYLAFLGLRIMMAPSLIGSIVLAIWLLPLQLRPEPARLPLSIETA